MSALSAHVSLIMVSVLCILFASCTSLEFFYWSAFLILHPVSAIFNILLSSPMEFDISMTCFSGLTFYNFNMHFSSLINPPFSYLFSWTYQLELFSYLIPITLNIWVTTFILSQGFVLFCLTNKIPASIK